MASITIRISEELKTRMDAAGDTVDWSAVTEAAFEQALACPCAPRGLDAVRQAIRDSLPAEGPSARSARATAYRAGREWARDIAGDRDLERLSSFQWHNHVRPLAVQVSAAILGEDAGSEHAHDFWVARLGSSFPSDATLAGFVEGALDVWIGKRGGA